MKGNRLATFGPRDKVLAAKVQSRQTRIRAKAARRKKVRSEGTATTTSVDALSISDSDNMTGDDVASVDSEVDSSTARTDVDISTTTPRSHHRTARTGTTAFIPHDIMKRPKLVALATRLKMTPVQQAIYTEALIAEAGEIHPRYRHHMQLLIRPSARLGKS